jgi:predicted nucleic acid-binding protein
MRDSVFFDSNLLGYYATDIAKKETLSKLMTLSYEVFISTQCLNEFTNVCLKKQFLNVEDIETSVKNYTILFDIFQPNQETVLKALDIHKRYRYSFYDSLIIASALLTISFNTS